MKMVKSPREQVTFKSIAWNHGDAGPTRKQDAHADRPTHNGERKDQNTAKVETR